MCHFECIFFPVWCIIAREGACLIMRNKEHRSEWEMLSNINSFQIEKEMKKNSICMAWKGRAPTMILYRPTYHTGETGTIRHIHVRCEGINFGSFTNKLDCHRPNPEFVHKYYYTERQRNLITSSERRSLNPPQDSSYLAQISYSSPYEAHLKKKIKGLLFSKRRKMRWNRQRSFFKNHRNCSLRTSMHERSPFRTFNSYSFNFNGGLCVYYFTLFWLKQTFVFCVRSSIANSVPNYDSFWCFGF